MSGPAAAQPWHDAAGATFTTVVDPDNALGRIYDYKIIPNGLFVDEHGVLQGKWIGFSVDRAECVEAVNRFRAGTLAPFERLPEGAVGAPGVAPGSAPASGELTRVERELYETRVRFGAELLSLGKKDPAAAEWQKALRMDPENFVLRKQIWLLRFPEKFNPEIDFEWQKAQLARERAEEAQACGPEGCLIPPR